MDSKRKRTLGERRVRLGFNPSGLPIVDKIKRVQADFIDLVDELQKERKRMREAEEGIATEESLLDDSEFFREINLAMTAAQSASQNAVGAVTMEVTPKYVAECNEED
jgi:hypothetical protein